MLRRRLVSTLLVLAFVLALPAAANAAITLKFTTPAPNGSANAVFAVSGTASSPTRPTIYAGMNGVANTAALVSQTPLSTTTDVTTGITSSVWQFSALVYTTGLPEGQATVFLQAFTPVEKAVARQMVVIDRTAPRPTIERPAQGAVVGRVLSAFGGASDAIGTVRVDGAIDSGTAAKPVKLYWNATAKTWSLQRETLDLADGWHTLYINAYDAAGNRGSWKQPFQVDHTGPALSIYSPAISPVLQTFSGSGYAQGFASDVHGVRGVFVWIDGNPQAAATMPLQSIEQWGGFSTQVSFMHQFSLLNYTIGTHTAYFRAYDGVGNNTYTKVPFRVG